MEKVVLSEEQQKQLDSNKFVRERLAWLHYRMESMQFFLTEAQQAHEARGILAHLCEDLQKKIEEVEPPVVQEEKIQFEAKKPFVVDVGTVVKGSDV